MINRPDQRWGARCVLEKFSRKGSTAIQPVSPKVTLRLVIHGYVQGVFFRDSMRREAQKLGVAGWVRNRIDGTVEAVVQGKSADVDAIVRWAQHGPERARVDRLEIEPAAGTYADFEIVYATSQ